MAENVDFKLVKGTDGIYDLEVDSDGDLKKEASFDTAILMSLLTEKRADSSEQIVPELRRGWWGNESNDVIDYEIGSKLWLLHQSKNIDETANKAVDYAIDCLQWLLDDNYLKDVIVTAVRSLSNITLNIQLVRNDNEVDQRFYELWDNTNLA